VTPLGRADTHLPLFALLALIVCNQLSITGLTIPIFPLVLPALHDCTLQHRLACLAPASGTSLMMTKTVSRQQQRVVITFDH
jgi:hypothetical protein